MYENFLNFPWWQKFSRIEIFVEILFRDFCKIRQISSREISLKIKTREVLEKLMVLICNNLSYIYMYFCGVKYRFYLSTFLWSLPLLHFPFPTSLFFRNFLHPLKFAGYFSYSFKSFIRILIILIHAISKNQ